MERHYTVSKDKDSGTWWVRRKGYAYTPIFAEHFEKRSDAVEYAKKLEGYLRNKLNKEA